MKKASIVYENTLSLSFMCSLRGREGRSQTELFSTNESEGYCSQIWSGYIGSWSDAWWPKSMLLLPKCVKENWQEQELKRWWTKLQQSRKTVLLSNLRLLLKPCCWRAYFQQQSIWLPRPWNTSHKRDKNILITLLSFPHTRLLLLSLCPFALSHLSLLLPKHSPLHLHSTAECRPQQRRRGRRTHSVWL